MGVRGVLHMWALRHFWRIGRGDRGAGGRGCCAAIVAPMLRFGQQMSSMSGSVTHLPYMFHLLSTFRVPHCIGDKHTTARGMGSGQGTRGRRKPTPTQWGDTYTCVRMPAAHLRLPSPSRPASSHQRHVLEAECAHAVNYIHRHWLRRSNLRMRNMACFGSGGPCRAVWVVPFTFPIVLFLFLCSWFVDLYFLC